ncbi:MAG: hypothetical protein JWN24_1354 [Phycisphaerales bacterium]|nr:hypothetical protein [Phycisphaerales bacterium]
MQKFVKILEQHVQWFALGLGVIYLGWMVYSYVVTPPITVKLGSSGQLYTAATADEQIWNSQAKPLESEINNKEPISVKPKDMAGELYAKLREETFKPIMLATNIGGVPYRPEAGKELTPAAGPTVVMLPHIPAAEFVAMSNSMTTVLIPAPVPAPAAGAPAAAPAAAGAAQPAPTKRDMNYVSVLYKINKDALGQQFKTAFANAKDPALLQTMFLEVEFYRQEQDANDATKWGNPVLLASLPLYELMKFPGDAALPNDPKKQEPFFAFMEWAGVNQEIIARPAFYDVSPDAPPWLFPGEAAPEPVAGAGAPAAAPARAFDPARDTPKTPEERQQWTAYHRSTMQPRGGRPGMPYPGRPGAERYYRPGGPNGAVPPRPVGTPGLPYPAPPTGSPYRRPEGLPFAAGQNNVTAGRFDANLLAGDIQILAHDINVEEGKTYRYALTYKLVNPLFGYFNGNPVPPAEPALMNTFALASPRVDAMGEKAWTKPVTIESNTRLWVSNINVYGGKASFDVFNYSSGRVHEQVCKDLLPGDPIGPSNWSVVDVRSDMRSKSEGYVIVMDGKGNLFRRDAAADKVDPELVKLKAQAGAAAAAH